MAMATGLRTLSIAAVVVLAVGAAASAQPASGWTYAAFMKAYEESGRTTTLTEAGFARIQERKARALKTIEAYLEERFGRADPLVMKAFAEVPREYFHYNYGTGRAFPEAAYEDNAKPWVIGLGSVLSDYLGQAYMTQLAGLTPASVVLEVGTGSGFQAAIFSRMARRVYSIEIIEPLGKQVAKIFRPLGYTNVDTKVGDGYFGWPEVSGGFDVIMFTCAAQYVPPGLFGQLRPGGRLIVPIGQPFKRGQFLYVYTKDAQSKIHSRKDVGVFFVPMTGEIMKHRQ
jgi:protein-L-isoaspartate(D-aspartate) O-methyltransferase